MTRAELIAAAEVVLSVIEKHGTISNRDDRVHALRGAAAALRAQAEAEPEAGAAGMVLAPDYRGYAHLGIGAYIINHSAELPAELVITPASEAEKAGREIGSEVINPDDAPPIQPIDMAVRLRFENVQGLDALETQLRHVRCTHFPDTAPPADDRARELLRQVNAVGVYRWLSEHHKAEKADKLDADIAALERLVEIYKEREKAEAENLEGRDFQITELMGKVAALEDDLAAERAMTHTCREQWEIRDKQIAALEADLAIEKHGRTVEEGIGDDLRRILENTRADLVAAQAATTPIVSHELWWLIEVSDGAALYATLEDDGAWTRDVYKAARFPTEKSAKFVMHQCHLWDKDRNGGYSVTKVYVAEHMFLQESCGQKDK